MSRSRFLMSFLVLLCFNVICECRAFGQIRQGAIQYQGSFGRVRGEIINYQTGGIYNKGNISPYYTILALGGGSYFNTYQVLRQQTDARTSSIDNRGSITGQIRPQFLSTSIAPAPLPAPVYARTTGHASRFLSYDFRNPQR